MKTRLIKSFDHDDKKIKSKYYLMSFKLLNRNYIKKYKR
jgi:hypothetical protein